MHFLGSVIKYLLRSVFSIIVFLLFVGLAKMNRDMNAYVSFLNSNDWSVFHWSQPATWGDPFWSHQNSGNIADMFLDSTVDAQLSGLDVYDPALEEDLNTITDTSLYDSTGEDFGFTRDEHALSGEIQPSSGATSQ